MENIIKLQHPEQRKTIDLRSTRGYEENPFIVDLKGKMYLQPKPNTIIARGEQIVDTTTGEIIEDSVLMGRRKVVDRTMFAKIYFSQIQAVFDLSKTAMKVLMCMAEKMGYDTMVLMNAKAEASKMGYKSQQAIQRAIKELINCGIIAQASIPSVYWMNPLYICKGERFAMYLEYTTKEYNIKSEERKEIIQNTLKQQAKEQYTPLDNRTAHSMNAMENRAEYVWEKESPEAFEKNFPGMSGEKVPRFQGNSQTGEFEVKEE